MADKLDVVVTVRSEEQGDTFKMAKYLHDECEFEVHTVLDASHAIFGKCDKAVFALLTAHPEIIKIEEND